jgi:hypothetical protein
MTANDINATLGRLSDEDLERVRVALDNEIGGRRLTDKLKAKAAQLRGEG